MPMACHVERPFMFRLTGPQRYQFWTFRNQEDVGCTVGIYLFCSLAIKFGMLTVAYRNLVRNRNGVERNLDSKPNSSDV